MTLIIFSFVVLPESLADGVADPGRLNRTNTRKVIPHNERIHADELAVVWHYDVGFWAFFRLFKGLSGPADSIKVPKLFVQQNHSFRDQ